MNRMETLGDTLRKERIRLKKNLSNISLDTRIDIKKLKAIEENNLSSFESPVSTKGFIKIYAEYLKLDPEKVLAIYRRDFGEKQPQKETLVKLEVEKKTPWRYLLLTIPIFLLIAIASYFFNQFSDFQNPPLLEILEPKDNITLQTETLIVKGKSEKDTIIQVGETKASLNQENIFESKIILQEGKNLITIRATNSRNPSNETVKVLNITYEPVKEIEEEKEIIEKIELQVTVANAPTWVEIVVDDQLLVSQVLQAGYKEEFTAEKNVSVNTGILENINVEVNGDRKILSKDNFSIQCEIIEEELKCK